MLVLGAFGGTSFLAHAHDGHDWHLHASSSIADARLSAEQHRLAHALGVATCGNLDADHDGHAESDQLPSDPTEGPGSPAPVDEPGDMVITIPDHEQLASRGIDLSGTFQAAQIVQSVITRLWTQPDVSEEKGSPGGLVLGGPPHLSSLTAIQRLVRTSSALLI